MRTAYLTGVAVFFAAILAGGSAQADMSLGVTGPITGANASFGAQLTRGVHQDILLSNRCSGGTDDYGATLARFMKGADFHSSCRT